MANTHQHHKIFRCQGGTDDPSNLVGLDFIDHAELHARDFLAGGPWFDFRHEGWPYLSKELREAVRAETGRRRSESQKGEDNPMFGQQRPDRREAWKGDNNPNRQPEALPRLRRLWEENLGPMFGEDNPFFGKQHTEETRRRLSEINRANPTKPMEGRNHTDEAKEKMRGPRPKMKGKKHWVNVQGKTCRSIECPGPEWQTGRVWKDPQ
jgi:hypothetical protein